MSSTSLRTSAIVKPNEALFGRCRARILARGDPDPGQGIRGNPPWSGRPPRPPSPVRRGTGDTSGSLPRPASPGRTPAAISGAQTHHPGPRQSLWSWHPPESDLHSRPGPPARTCALQAGRTTRRPNPFESTRDWHVGLEVFTVHFLAASANRSAQFIDHNNRTHLRDQDGRPGPIVSRRAGRGRDRAACRIGG